MSSAERIIIGVASLIALVGWLRCVGEASNHDHELRNQDHPTGPPKYQRPSRKRSEQAVGARQSVKSPAISPTLTTEAHEAVIEVNQTDHENTELTELHSGGRRV